jgi:hypothetical protein
MHVYLPFYFFKTTLGKIQKLLLFRGAGGLNTWQLMLQEIFLPYNAMNGQKGPTIVGD